MSITKTQLDFASIVGKVSNQKLSTAERATALGMMVDKYSDDISAILPAHVKLDRMKQLFILSVKNAPKLLDCDPGSLIKSLMTAASMGLEPDPYFGQLYLLPYGKNVQVIPGYKGLMKLVRNSGEIASISCEAVHENDKFHYQLGSDPKVDHEPALINRGLIMAFYCVARFKDGSLHIEWMNKEEVDRIMGMSSAVKRGGATPWNEHYEEMGKKTVFRRAVKRLPISLSREFSNALRIDDSVHNGQDYQIDEQTGEIIDIWADSPEPEESLSGVKLASQLDSFAPAEPVQTTLH